MFGHVEKLSYFCGVKEDYLANRYAVKKNKNICSNYCIYGNFLLPLQCQNK